MDHLTQINFARYKTSQVNHIKSKQTNGSYGKTQIITLLQSLIGHRQFLGTVLDLFVLLKLHVGICGFQFPEFLNAWQVEELDPDSFD